VANARFIEHAPCERDDVVRRRPWRFVDDEQT
jgi:hypothetical protein